MRGSPCTDGCGRKQRKRRLCEACYRRREAAGTLPPADYCGPTLPDLRALGITYRKLDYWTRAGLLHADDPTPGSGHRRGWPPAELEVAARIARLTKAGLALDIASRVARQPDVDVPLAPGVFVSVRSLEVAS